jgi:hypothetical protein
MPTLWYPCCGATSGCACCSGTTPTTISLTVSGITGGSGGICTNANGTYTLDIQPPSENCGYRFEQWIVAPTRLRVIATVGFTCSGSDTMISVSFTVDDSVGNKSTGWTWTKTISGKPIDCSANRTSFTESGVTTGIFGDACDTTFPTMSMN